MNVARSRHSRGIAARDLRDDHQSFLFLGIAVDRIRGGADQSAARRDRRGWSGNDVMIPMGGHIIRPNPYLVDQYPDFYLSMGLAAENLARKYQITREQQDDFRSSHTDGCCGA